MAFELGRAMLAFRNLVAAVTMAVTFAVLPVMAQPLPDAERVDLASQLVDVVSPRSGVLERGQVESSVALMKGLVMMTAAFSGGMPELDERQFDASLKAGAEAAQAQERMSRVQTWARAMTADDLRAALAFYRSPAGRAALKSREKYFAKLLAYVRSAEFSKAAGAERQFPDYVPTSAEQAFASSPAGQAIAAAPTPDADGAGIDALQSPIEVAEADYCAKVTCGEDQHEFFKRMGAGIAIDRAHGEHAMFGDTAGDLFPDSKVAALARAACTGDVEAVTLAIKDGADPNAVGKEGTGPGGVREVVTPLLWALDCRSLPGVTALLDAGANPNQVEEWGATPVTVAASYNDPAFLRLLLNRGGDPNAQDDQETALAIAMGTANGLEWVDEVPAAQAWANWDALLAAGADPLREAPAGLPFMTALAFAGRWDKVEWLMDRGWAGDPVDLGRSLETDEEGPQTHTPDASAARARVKARLIAKGVKFPIGALMDLKRDERGSYIQP
ncbi:MAG: ankyrin repeat domain-containing protein [Caulobacter sp.]|nr:ankyrin repeat domain-containing protein [Caulobacter sp.]